MADASAFRGLVQQLYERDFPAAQSAWVEEFLVLLIELRRTFGNDLDKIIILSVIGQQMLRDPALPPIAHSALRQNSLPRAKARETNIDAVARASHIPRESVRRKVNELIADALVERLDTGGIAVRAGAAARLAPATLVSIAMLDSVISKYLALLGDHGLLAARATVPAANGKRGK